MMTVPVRIMMGVEDLAAALRRWNDEDAGCERNVLA